MYPTPLVIRGMSKKEKGSTPKIALYLEKPFINNNNSPQNKYI
jgi:hypothetical protein